MHLCDPSYTRLGKTAVNSLMITAVKEIGRSWVQPVSGDFFGRGLMSAIFQGDGTLCCRSELLNTSVTAGARSWAKSLKKGQYGSSSGPQLSSQ